MRILAQVLLTMRGPCEGALPRENSTAPYLQDDGHPAPRPYVADGSSTERLRLSKSGLLFPKKADAGRSRFASSVPAADSARTLPEGSVPRLRCSFCRGPWQQI